MSEKQVNLLIFQYLPPLLPHRISCSDASQMLLRAELKLSIFFFSPPSDFIALIKWKFYGMKIFCSLWAFWMCAWNDIHYICIGELWKIPVRKILPFFPSRENRFIFCKFSHSQFHTAFHGELFGFLRYCRLHKFNLLYYFKDILNMSAF